MNTEQAMHDLLLEVMDEYPMVDWDADDDPAFVAFADCDDPGGTFDRFALTLAEIRALPTAA